MRKILLGLALAATACGSAASSSDGKASAIDLTSVAPSTPVQQSIGNCWVFATNSWIETMSGRPTGATPVDLSEAYVSYLYWLDQISTPPAPGMEGIPFIVHPTGSWGLAADLLTRFGWMPEADFLSEPATTTFAERHEQALTAIQHEIDHGALQTAAQRADRKLVAATLAKAWGLKDDVVADLVHAFGEAYDQDLQNGHANITGTRIHKLSEITVG